MATTVTGELRVFKILHLDECPANPIESSRGGGDQIKLVRIRASAPRRSTSIYDNRLVPGGPRGKLHHHTKADNVYIVKRGEGTFDRGWQDLCHPRERCRVYSGRDDPLPRENLSDQPFEIFEIYAPSGQHFDFVVDE